MLTRMVALGMFLACCAAGFSFALLAMTFATGKLPFGMEPAMRTAPPDPPKPPAPAEKYRSGEKWAQTLFSQLEERRRQAATDTASMKEKEALAEATAENARKLMGELQTSQLQIDKLMLKIDKTERANIQKVAIVVEGMSAKAAGDMLIQMLEEKPDMVPKIMTFIKPKVASKILSSIADTPDKDRLAEAAKLAYDMRKVMENN